MIGYKAHHLSPRRSLPDLPGRRPGLPSWLVQAGRGCGVIAAAAAVTAFVKPEWRLDLAQQLMPTSTEQAADTLQYTLPELVGVSVPPGSATVASAPSVAATTAAAEAAVQALAGNGNPQSKRASGPATREQAMVIDYIVRKYRTTSDTTTQFVQTAYAAGREVGLDPMLILAVMAVESSFNPHAESEVGAQGLMQVMTRVHQDKYAYFGGIKAALDPFANIKVGARILKDCIQRGGSLEDGLRLYVGSASSDDGGYGSRVLAERVRMSSATGRAIPLSSKPAQRPSDEVAGDGGTDHGA